MKNFTWKKPKIVGLLILLFFVQGCSLAIEGNAIEETQDKLVGAWVILKQDDMDLDYEEVDLEDFKKEDSTVLYLEMSNENEAISVDYKTTGNIYPNTTNFKHVGEDMETEVKAMIFFSSSSPELVKLYRIFEKPNGEHYAVGDMVWMMVDTANTKGVVGSQGAMYISNSYIEKREDQDIEKKVTIMVEFERIRDLVSTKMIHLDENYNVILEEDFDLKQFDDQEEPISYQVNPDAKMVLVEEIFTTPLEKTPYVVKTLYAPTLDEEITHDFILPKENQLAKKETVKFIFN